MGGASRVPVLARVRVGDGCWEFVGPVLARGGHGQAWNPQKKRSTSAHRVAFWEWFGRWPSGQLNHTCDNARCCRPSHLREGTHSDNMKDRAARTWRPAKRLSEEQVEKIMTDHRPNTRVALDYGVSDVTIATVRNERGAYGRR